MPAVEFEPTIAASEWPQTRALDGAATGNGINTDECYAVGEDHSSASVKALTSEGDATRRMRLTAEVKDPLS